MKFMPHGSALGKLLLITLWACVSVSAQGESSSAQTRFEALRSEADKLMQQYHVPGVAIGVIDGNSELIAGLGVTNVDHPEAVDGDTLFAIGSITKTFTTAALVMLAERGEVDLDEKVTSIIPDFHVADEQATQQTRLRDLFQHRTGWRGDHFIDTGQGEDALEKSMLQLYYLPQITPPGKVWTYNNVNYMIAGRVIEFVTQKSYESVIQQELLAPLAMRDSGFDPRFLLAKRNSVGHAGVYTPEEKPGVSEVPFFRAIYSAGGLRSSMRDMLKFVHFQFTGKDAAGNQILSKQALQEMHSKQVKGELDEWTGLTWFVEDIGDVTTVSHAGRWIGYTAKLLMVPEKQFAIVIVTNNDRGGEVYDPLIAMALKDRFGVERKAKEPLAFDRQALGEFEGIFEGNNEDYRFFFQGDEMLVERRYIFGVTEAFKPPPAMPIDLVGPDMFMIRSGPSKGATGELLRDEKGRPRYLRLQHRLFSRISEE